MKRVFVATIVSLLFCVGSLIAGSAMVNPGMVYSTTFEPGARGNYSVSYVAQGNYVANCQMMVCYGDIYDRPINWSCVETRTVSTRVGTQSLVTSKSSRVFLLQFQNGSPYPVMFSWQFNDNN